MHAYLSRASASTLLSFDHRVHTNTDYLFSSANCLKMPGWFSIIEFVNAKKLKTADVNDHQIWGSLEMKQTKAEPVAPVQKWYVARSKLVHHLLLTLIINLTTDLQIIIDTVVIIL